MYIIGSTAIKHWFPDFPREPKDLDYFVSDNIVQNKTDSNEKRIEYLRNPIICREMWERNKVTPLDNYSDHVTPTLLLTNLMSHIFWQTDAMFDKHMFSIQFLLDKGVQFDRNLFYELYQFWPEIHGPNRRSNLELSSDQFFDNAINPNQGISHDELHYLILDEGQDPAYKQILVGEVLTSDELFDKLPHEEKIKIVFEETLVMSMERFSGVLAPIRYLRQLRQMITGHLTIHASIFAIINYKELVGLAKKVSDGDYFSKVNQKLKEQCVNYEFV